ncbi:glycoside hydrolase family 4 [Haladaptatus pallidirubidus]|uniref:Alpha-glucosidase/alpha-galactosidase n=1 Tax=Haladaptatus pallidirubidus TaxID=1008152 RepID=A0AAV3UJ78_9EURY|nr:glycoside hydrolase family 4 [Haladaptatus pallidirubidus]
MESEIGNKTDSGATVTKGKDLVEDIKIGYIGGGSRGWAYTLINDLAQCKTITGEVVLYDRVFESAKRNERFGNWVQDREDAVGDWEYTAVEDRATALEGADFVVLSTQDPPPETMAHELDIPAKYGIYQSVGDTVGPGGTVRAMRTIPVYRDIAGAIREHCPEAWVINYTNPMTICVRTLYEEYPDINAVGCCHEVFHTQEHLAKLVGKYRDTDQPSRKEINVNVKGINHFTWIDEMSWRGENLHPLLETHLKEEIRDRSFEPGSLDEDSYFVDNELVTYELYERFGIFPAAGDRHLAEFVPWFLTADDAKDVQQWGIRLTPSEYRVNRQEDALTKFHGPMNGEEEFEFFESGEELVDIIHALLGFEDLKTNLNMPNCGQVSNLPENAVVETNALFTDDCVMPLTSGELPAQVHNIVSTHVVNQETLIKAGFSGDVDLAFQAFLNDPLVTISMTDARAMFNELMTAVRPYLEDHWNLDNASVVH